MTVPKIICNSHYYSHLASRETGSESLNDLAKVRASKQKSLVSAVFIMDVSVLLSVRFYHAVTVM